MWDRRWENGEERQRPRVAAVSGRRAALQTAPSKQNATEFKSEIKYDRGETNTPPNPPRGKHLHNPTGGPWNRRRGRSGTLRIAGLRCWVAGAVGPNGLAGGWGVGASLPPPTSPPLLSVISPSDGRSTSVDVHLLNNLWRGPFERSQTGSNQAGIMKGSDGSDR